MFVVPPTLCKEWCGCIPPKGALLLAFIVQVFLVILSSMSGYDKALNSNSISVSLELTINRRKSVREFTEAPLLWETLSDILWAAYGHSSWERTTPNICGSYPIVIYACNETAAYVYEPEEQALRLSKEGDYRSRGAYRAPVQLFLVLNGSKSSDLDLASIEAGCIVQNIYLEASDLGLGTVCVGGGIDRKGVHDALSLSDVEEVICNMPLGYPRTPFNFSPIAAPRSSNLPEVLEGAMSLREALLQAFEGHGWSETSLTYQEQSQILWAAYGYSLIIDLTQSSVGFNINRHRTVPSAYNSYALMLLVLNNSGTYRYVPSSHSLEVIREGDERLGVATACNQAWAASAPIMLAVIWNSSKDPRMNMVFAAVECGCIIQNVRLEAVSWGLIADNINVVDEDAVREALRLSDEADLRPLFVVTVGYPLTYKFRVLDPIRTLTISTNSTITGFMSERRIIVNRIISEDSFHIAGTPGTTGFCNATIPLGVGQPHPSLFIDGVSVDHVSTWNSTHLSLYFTYDHNVIHSVNVLIEYSSDVQPDRGQQIILLLIVASLMTIIVYLIAQRRRP